MIGSKSLKTVYVSGLPDWAVKGEDIYWWVVINFESLICFIFY